MHKNVVTGTVPFQKSEGVGQLFVQAVLNGKLTTTMIWDSGADIVTLGPATWKALGIHATDKDPTMVMRIADGSQVNEKVVELDSIRLGGFTLRNVECVLVPDIPGVSKVDDLLGDTFQSHFLSRLDQRTRQLQLTPIDSSVTLGPVAEPLAKITPGPNDSNPDLARRATVTASSTYEGYDPRRHRRRHRRISQIAAK